MNVLVVFEVCGYVYEVGEFFMVFEVFDGGWFVFKIGDGCVWCILIDVVVEIEMDWDVLGSFYFGVYCVLMLVVVNWLCIKDF